MEEKEINKEINNIYSKLKKLCDSEIWDAQLIMEVFGCNAVVADQVLRKLADEGYLEPI